MRSRGNEGFSKVSRRWLLGAALPGAAWLRAQQEPKPTFTAGVKVVSVLATVRDKKSKIVSDLKQDDFQLEEEGKPQTIRYFTRETNLALTLGSFGRYQHEPAARAGAGAYREFPLPRTRAAQG